jgi:hypothetical protein
MVELDLPSTLAPPTSFCYSEFPKTVKLAGTAAATGMLTVIVTETGIVKQGALCSKKLLVVFATIFHQPSF